MTQDEVKTVFRIFEDALNEVDPFDYNEHKLWKCFATNFVREFPDSRDIIARNIINLEDCK